MIVAHKIYEEAAAERQMILSYYKINRGYIGKDEDGQVKPVPTKSQVHISDAIRLLYSTLKKTSAFASTGTGGGMMGELTPMCKYLSRPIIIS